MRRIKVRDIYIYSPGDVLPGVEGMQPCSFMKNRNTVANISWLYILEEMPTNYSENGYRVLYDIQILGREYPLPFFVDICILRW